MCFPLCFILFFDVRNWSFLTFVSVVLLIVSLALLRVQTARHLLPWGKYASSGCSPKLSCPGHTCLSLPWHSPGKSYQATMSPNHSLHLLSSTGSPVGPSCFWPYEAAIILCISLCVVCVAGTGECRHLVCFYVCFCEHRTVGSRQTWGAPS